MTRQSMYGLVVLVLAIALNGAFPTRLIRTAVAEASSKQDRQLQPTGSHSARNTTREPGPSY